jgi:hypothetical protein
MITELTSAIRSRQLSNPRTVLGFYAVVLALLLSGDVAAVGVLASTRVSTFLIPWLLGFGGLVLLLLLVGVFIVTLIDPSKLMLGQITGIEYARIHSITLGDSDSGERIQSVIEPVAGDELIISMEPLANNAIPAELEEGDG